MKVPCRVVLDTNVVLSALVFRRGVAGALRPAWQSGVFVPLVSKVTAQELVRVLGYPKFRLTASDQEELLADYLPYAQTVRVPDPPPKVPDCRDPFDLPFLHLAVAGRAQVLVSGDLDVLSMASTFERLHGCPILSLDAFYFSHCVN
jgi:putative PIN family toxin of toxin-antitoxin system